MAVGDEGLETDASLFLLFYPLLFHPDESSSQPFRLGRTFDRSTPAILLETSRASIQNSNLDRKPPSLALFVPASLAPSNGRMQLGREQAPRRRGSAGRTYHWSKWVEGKVGSRRGRNGALSDAPFLLGEVR